MVQSLLKFAQPPLEPITVRDEISQETHKTSVLVQGQHHGRNQSCRQAYLKAQLSDQDASLMIHFDAEHAQSTGGSQ